LSLPGNAFHQKTFNGNASIKKHNTYLTNNAAKREYLNIRGREKGAWRRETSKTRHQHRIDIWELVMRLARNVNQCRQARRHHHNPSPRMLADSPVAIIFVAFIDCALPLDTIIATFYQLLSIATSDIDFQG